MAMHASGLNFIENANEHYRGIATRNLPRYREFDAEIQAFFVGLDLEQLLRKEGKVLELGCGEGNTLRWMAKNFRIVPHGVDIEFYNIAWKDIFPFLTRGVEFRKGNIENLPYEDDTFDFIFAYKAFVYTINKLLALKEAHRVLKIGGVAAIELETLFTRDPRMVQPPIEEILEGFPNDGQLRLEKIYIDDGKFGFYRIQPHQTHRITMRKTTSKSLQFPELVQACKYKRGSVVSVYQNSKIT